MKNLKRSMIFMVFILMVSGVGGALSVAHADGVPEFDTETRILSIPLIQVNGHLWFSGVEVFMGLDGTYQLLEATPINCAGFSPPNPLCFLSTRDASLFFESGEGLLEFKPGCDGFGPVAGCDPSLEPSEPSAEDEQPVDDEEPIYPDDDRLGFKPGCNGFGPSPGCD